MWPIDVPAHLGRPGQNVCHILNRGYFGEDDRPQFTRLRLVPSADAYYTFDKNEQLVYFSAKCPPDSTSAEFAVFLFQN